MEIRNIAELLKQWCIDKIWSARKELRESHITNSADLQSVLSTRSKSNFTMELILVRCCDGTLIRTIYLKALLTCPRLFHQFRYVTYHCYFLLELSAMTRILLKKHSRWRLFDYFLFFAIINQTYVSSQKHAICVIAYNLSHLFWSYIANNFI